MTNTSVRWQRWTGVAAVVVLWVTQILAVALARYDLVGERPLSDLANVPGSGWLFSLGLIVAAVLFLVFLRYLRRMYPVGAAFSAAMAIGMTGQLVAGILPIGGDGWVSRVHVMSALVLGASIPLLMWRFAADQPAGPWRRRSYGLFWLEAMACIVGIGLSQAHIAPIAEILPAMAFHLWVVIVTLGPHVTAEPNEAPGDLPADDRMHRRPPVRSSSRLGDQVSTVSRMARTSSP